MTSKKFAAELAALGKRDEITVSINSPGGAVFDGIAIYNALVAHPARVDVVIDGLAASIASVIAMAGDRITMRAGAMMM
ncbi:MAG TPA: Clp protease ClpP, partial [Gammaproteobacteria bacterium]